MIAYGQTRLRHIVVGSSTESFITQAYPVQSEASFPLSGDSFSMRSASVQRLQSIQPNHTNMGLLPISDNRFNNQFSKVDVIEKKPSLVDSFIGGLLTPIRFMFSSKKNFLISAGVIAAIVGLAFLTGSAILPYLLFAGITLVGLEGIYAIYRIINAQTLEDKREAWNFLGSTIGSMGIAYVIHLLLGDDKYPAMPAPENSYPPMNGSMNINRGNIKKGNIRDREKNGFPASSSPMNHSVNSIITNAFASPTGSFANATTDATRHCS